MNDSCLPVKILPKGWKQIEFSDRFFADGTSITRSIPNNILLDELIRIPQSSDFDPFELQKYRNKFLPQQYDYENQKLLRTYSNNLVEGLIENFSIHQNQSEVDKFLRSFCTRHNLNYENYRYNLLVMSYCMDILPFRRRDRISNARLDILFNKIYGQCKTGTDFMKINSSVNSSVEINGIKIFDISVGEMMDQSVNETTDINFINKIYGLQEESLKITGKREHSEEERNRIKTRKIAIEEWQVFEEDRKERKRVEALRTWRFSEFDVAMRSVKSFNNQILWKGEIQEYNQAVSAEKERNRREIRLYQERKGAVPCLRQCIFCYRFKPGTGKISRTCLSDKCKSFEKEILKSIGKENAEYLRF